MRILLVDDDVFLRDMYSTKFTEAGHEVCTAASGKEALQLVEDEGTFDVIMMDIVMPSMSGFELLELLTEEEKAKDALKIVLSNQGEESDKSKAKSAGVAGYIVKAESIPSEVVRKVESLVGSS